jgi:predicted RNA methylase
LALCHYIRAAVANSSEWNGKHIIELGAGTGLVGVYCSIMGARVTMTDRSDLLRVMNLTVDANATSTSLPIHVGILPPP